MADDYSPTPDGVRASYEEDMPPNFTDVYLANKISEAEIVLTSKVGDLSNHPADTVKMLLIRAVLRVVRNPSGYAAESEGNYNYNLSPRTGSGTIWYPDDEVGLLIPADFTVGSIRTHIPRRRWP